MPDIGLSLTIAGIGIAILAPSVQYAVKDVPWYVSYGGISLGLGIVIFGFLVLFFPPVSTISHLVAADATSLENPNPSLIAQKQPGDDDPLLRWDDHLGHTYSSSEDGTIYTRAIQISAVNVSTHEIQIENAYIVSGETGEKIPLKVGAIGAGWIFPRETNPIPPKGTITLRAEFAPPVGIAASDLFNKWKVIHLVTQYDGGIHRKLIDENMIAAIYSSFRPNPIGPGVTRRQDQ